MSHGNGKPSHVTCPRCSGTGKLAIPTDFGGRIAYEREKRGLTQRELGKAIGVSNTTVYHWECGENEPSLSLAKRALEYFGLELGDLA